MFLNSGAASTGTVSYVSLASYHNQKLPSKCVSVRCQGYENSLAECVIYDKKSVGNGDVATVTCIQPPGPYLQLLLYSVCFNSVGSRDVCVCVCFRGAVRVQMCEQEVCVSQSDM